MEPETYSSFMSECVKKYRYYCLFMLRIKLHKSPKVIAIFHIFHFLQVLTLIFRPEEHLGLPWNYYSLSTVWIGLSIVTRPSYLALYLGFEHAWFIFYLIIWAYLLTKLLIIYTVKLREFVACIPCDALGANWMRKYLLYLHTYSNTILFTLQPICTIQSLISMPVALSDIMNSTLTIFISSLHILIYIIIYLEDSLLLQKLSWISYKHHEIISSSEYIIVYRMLFLAINFTVYYIELKKSYIVYSLILIGIGTYQAIIFVVKLPYGSLYRNIARGSEGLLIMWGGFVLCLAELNEYTDQDSYYSTLIFFIPIGFLIYIYKEIIQYRYRYLIRNKTFLNSTQVFHIFLTASNETYKSQLDHSSEDLRHLIRSAMIYDPKNYLYFLWLIYLMTLNEKLMPVKILISELINLKSIKSIIYIEQAREDYYESIKSLTTEREAYIYLLYISTHKDLLEADKKSTNYLINLYNDLLSSYQDSFILSSDMKYFHKSILITRDLYSYMIKIFPNSPIMYEMYAGYLDVIENSPDAKEEIVKAARYKEDVIRKEENKEMEISYLDPGILILIMSADSKSLGVIIDIKNSGGFGYEHFQLENENVSMIFPTMIYNSYIKQLNTLYDIWYNDSYLQVAERSYIWRHGGYLIPVIVRNSVINLDSGELAVVLAVKRRKNCSEIAILNEEGRFILCFVIDI